MRLGKKPARPDAVSFKFSQFFQAGNLPVPPKSFGHYTGISWGMLANDKWGDCVLAGGAHETMALNKEGGHVVQFTDAAVLSDYTAITGFDPNKPDSDQGTDMTEAASYRRKTGLVDATGMRHKVDSYLALHPGNVSQLALATYILGVAAVGIQFPDSAMDQFDQGKIWDVVPGAQVDGGHYVPCVGRNASGNFIVVTWGRLQAMTPAFFEKYCDEALGYVSLEMLKNKLSPEGFDADGLRKALSQITRKKVAMEGTQINPDEVDAVRLAVTNLADSSGLGLYRRMLSETMLQQVAEVAVEASVKFRNTKEI